MLEFSEAIKEKKRYFLQFTQILTVIQYNQQPYGGQGEVYFNAGMCLYLLPFFNALQGVFFMKSICWLRTNLWRN